MISFLVIVGKFGVGWFRVDRYCIGGEGFWWFGVVSKGGGDGGVLCMIGDFFGLVGGFGLWLVGLLVIIEIVVRSFLIVEFVLIIIGLVWILLYCCWFCVLNINFFWFY